jgi:small-conductance mechanosensitive channel
METIRDLLQNILGFSPETQDKLFSTVLIVIGLWLLRALINHFINRRFQGDPRVLYNSRKATEYVLAVVGVFLIGRLWLEGIQSLATYVGLLSAGLAIALQDLIINLAGWLFILWQRPFIVGDRIEIGDIAGDVINQSIFNFNLLEIGNLIESDQSTGRIVHVPNGFVFKQSLVNYSQGIPYIWHEIPVLITYESDWEKAKTLLNDIINIHAPTVDRESLMRSQRAKRFVVSYNTLTPTVYTKVVDSGVQLTIRYLIQPRRRRNSEQIIWEAILKAFAPHWDIDFAYPTQREYLHFREGKKPPGSRTVQDARTQTGSYPRPTTTPTDDGDDD